MNALNTIFCSASIVAIIALPFMIVNWAKYMKGRPTNRFAAVPSSFHFPTKSVMLFVVSVVVAITIAQLATSYSRRQMLKFIQTLSEPYTVYVNNQPAPHPDRVIAALKAVAPQLASHSHSTTRIRIDIQSQNGNITLELGRDSAISQEYWVFYPKYQITSNNEIGRITTPVFDGY